jgi:phosphonate transport system substrate-binding protein
MVRTLLAAGALLAALPAAAAETLRFAVADLEGIEQLQQEFGVFETTFEELTGFELELFPVSSRTSAVESLNAGQVDLILVGPAEYVVMKELADPQIVVGWQRPNYYSQIVVMADGPIKDIDDLRGQKVTFGSVGSTSQHLGPAQVLADFGLRYGVDYEPMIVARNVAVEALIRNDVQAVGMNETHLRAIREAFPDQAFMVIARGRDLPNDILVARKDLDPAIVEQVRAAFEQHGEALMAAVLTGEDNKKFEGGFFFTDIEDSDYDYVRAMYATIGVDTSAFVGE